MSMASADLPAFIPASSWEGSKPFYYFGTTKEKGTGYHLDEYQLKKNKKLQQPSRKKHKQLSEIDLPSAKRTRRSVVIAEDKNEIRTIPSSAGQALLQQAEEAAKGTRILELTPRGVQIAIKNLKRAQERNQLSRAEFPDDPEQYMDSELALYEAITALQPIATDPAKLYPQVLNSTHYDSPEQLWATTFSQLCMHDNSDVVSSVVALLLEWLDPALMNMEQSNQHPRNRYILLLGQAIVENLLELLVANLARLPSTSLDDGTGIGKGIDDVLSLIENILELDLMVQNNNESMLDSENETSEIGLVDGGGSVAAKIVEDTPFLSWLFEQIGNGTSSKDRSLELLSFLVQREEVHHLYPNWTDLPAYKSVFSTGKSNGEKSRKEKDIVIDGMEIILLHGIAPFRKKQPADETEVESLENACIAVEAALTFSPQNVQAFLDAQGIELVVRCLKEKVHAGGVGLKLLDFSGSDPVYQKACEHLVSEAGGLKHLFPLWMGRQLPKPAMMSWVTSKSEDSEKKNATSALSKAKKEWFHMIENQTIRILYALTRHLTDQSPCDARQRVLAKFLEDDKIDRLVELCLAYDQKARMAEFKFWKSDVEDELNAEEAIQLAALEAKLRGGGDIFHRLGAIAGFCCIGSKRCHERVLSQLSLQRSGVAVIKAALEEFIDVLGPGKQADQLQIYFNGI